MEITSSLALVIFVLTFGVGYVILIWVYSNANRLREWYELNVFDKTMMTFIVGGTVTFFSLLIMKAPFHYLLSGSWELWLQNNLGGLIIAESLVIMETALLVRTYLVEPMGRMVGSV